MLEEKEQQNNETENISLSHRDKLISEKTA